MQTHTLKYNKTNILVLCGLITAAQAHDELEETVVVASRSELEHHRIVDSVSIVGGEDLVSSGLINLSDGLNSIPGVNGIGTSGQRGASSSVFIRGFSTSNSQIRLDGVRVSNRTFALGTVLGQLTTNSFEKIEVLKGGNAALYGSSTAGGVINLTTRSGIGEGSSFDIEAGSFDTLRANLTHAGSVGKLDYFTQQSFEYTENDTFGGNSEIPGFDNDFVQRSSVIKLDYRVNDDVVIGASYRINDGEFESPQGGGTLTDSRTEFGSLYVDAWLTDDWSSKLTVGWFREDSVFLTGLFGDSENEYEQLSVVWENTYNLSPETQISFGAEFEDQDFQFLSVSAFGTSVIEENDQYVAGYVNVNHQFTDAFTVQGGVRYEDFDTFGEEVNWKFGARYNFKDSTVVRASVGTGFRAPTYFDLFFPGSGNANLEAEESTSWEVAIERNLGDNHRLELVYFESDVDSLIGGFPTVNIPGESTANGIEASLHGEITSEISYEANYTWLERSFSGQPEQTANLSVNYKPTDKWNTGFTVAYVDQRNFGAEDLDDYVKVDAYVNYQVTDSLKLSARIENAFDESYELFSGFGDTFNARRLGVFGGVTYTW